MSARPVHDHSGVQRPRLHCPYCGDDFLLSQGTRLEGFGVICPNVKCGSRIRLDIRLPESDVVALNEQ